MALSGHSGPMVVFGQSPMDNNPAMSPSMFWGGLATLDSRPPFTFMPGESASSIDYGWLGVDNITTLAITPYTASATAIATGVASPTTNVPLVNASSAVTGVYLSPGVTRSDTGVLDTGVNGAGVVCIDAYNSIAGVTIAAGVMTVAGAATQPISPGQQLLTSTGAVTAGGPLAGAVVTAQLTGTPGVAGTYQLSNGALTAASGTVTAAWPNVQACAVGFGQPPSMACWNPAAMSARAVSIASGGAGTATTATVNGYDVYGYPMSEAITLAAGAGTGKKAFKYIRSVVLNAADAGHAYTVGTQDVYGLPLRADNFSDLLINSGPVANMPIITAVAGFTAGVTATPTATTGDVRGTYAFTSATGANKLVVRQSPQAYNIALNGVLTGLFGPTPFASF